MIYDWAKPGVKVVCLDASDTNNAGIPEIVHGAIYTIAQVILDAHEFPCGSGHEHSRINVRLFEVHRVSGCPFALSRFRPLVTPGQTQTIEDLKAMMRKHVAKQGADA